MPYECRNLSSSGLNILMRWSCGTIMHCFVYLHGTFKAHKLLPRSTFPQSLWGCVTCFTIEVEIASNINIANYTHQEGNILELLLTRHCFHGVMISSMGVSTNQQAVTSRDDTCTSRCANVIVYYIRISLHNNRIYWYVSCIIRFLCLYLKVEIVR